MLQQQKLIVNQHNNTNNANCNGTTLPTGHKALMNTGSYGEHEPLLLVDAEAEDEAGTNLETAERRRLIININNQNNNTNSNIQRCVLNSEANYNAYALTPVHESINFIQSFNNCNF